MSAPRLRLEDPPTAIRPTSPEDADEQLELRRVNREHTSPWDPRRDESFYSIAGQRLELELDARAWAAGTAYAFAVLAMDEDDRIVGRVALANVVRGPWQNATLGYYIDEARLNRGFATDAVRVAVRYAFDVAGLHRVQAGVLVDNARSVRVLEKAGFRPEGTSLRYLYINGRWRDHLMFAVTREEWPPQA
jgi:ribosomal-protein-alanine N-acetyltransferase